MSTEQNKTLTLGSLFDGSGGFPLGGLLTLKYMVIVIEPSGISVSYSVGRSAFDIIS